ncbi:MAG: cobalamin-dependent protein, partial [Candidatus Methanomethylophilaceae archaeon]
MADNNEILADLKKSVETWNLALAKTATQAGIDAGMAPKDIINAMGDGMAVVGERFDRAEVYLPQVVAASKAMDVGLKLLAPLMKGDDDAMRGTVVMGTVEGDIHEIGKNVCCAMLRGAGYNVIDLGPDASAEKFVDTALENKAKVVGGSALMTTTLLAQKEIVELIKERGLDIKTVF